MKKVLIISPYFPPFNTADMQRVRQSLPYFRQNGWEPTVLTVDEKYVDAYSVDELLLQTLPPDLEIHKVPALNSNLTRKFGIGSLSLRAFFSIQKKGDELLRSAKFDLVYFSTTAFHVMALGPRWKRKFGVPFVLDIQDPWYNEFYFQNALKNKTLKARLFHGLDKCLEKKTLPYADGIVSVSAGYRELYANRYPVLTSERFRIIPFGCAVNDFDIVKRSDLASQVIFSTEKVNVVYIGRGGEDMSLAAEIAFEALKVGLNSEPDLFGRLHFWFIGTSYANGNSGTKTIEPIAHNLGLSAYVTEQPARLPYFETLKLLQNADLLFVPGSTDPTYTASKIYPYIFVNKPLLAIFHKKSSVCGILKETSLNSKVVTFEAGWSEDEREQAISECLAYLHGVLKKEITSGGLNLPAFEAYTASAMTEHQTRFFDEVVRMKSSKPAAKPISI